MSFKDIKDKIVNYLWIPKVEISPKVQEVKKKVQEKAKTVKQKLVETGREPDTDITSVVSRIGKEQLPSIKKKR